MAQEHSSQLFFNGLFGESNEEATEPQSSADKTFDLASTVDALSDAAVNQDSKPSKTSSTTQGRSRDQLAPMMRNYWDMKRR